MYMVQKIGSLLKVSINILVYHSKMAKDFDNSFDGMTDKHPDVRPYGSIVFWSSCFASLDSMSAYFLLFSVIKIPYQW